MTEFPDWPWPEIPHGAIRLDWATRLQSDPAAAWCDIRYAVLTEDQLIFLVDVTTPDFIDFVEETRAPRPKLPEDPRFWISVGGMEVESIGEWDGIDPDRIKQLEHAEIGLHDWVGPLGDELVAVTVSPPPKGKFSFSAQWHARGLDRCSVEFELKRSHSSR